jgi:hypothetical protein
LTVNEDTGGDHTGGNTLVTVERGGGAPLEDALLTALQRAGFELAQREPPLREFVNVDALGQLEWHNSDLEIRTSVWGHPVRITADRVRVYPPGAT